MAQLPVRLSKIGLLSIMTAASAAAYFAWPLKRLQHYLISAIRRYNKLHVLGKLFVWFLICFHIALVVLLIFVGPGRIAQLLYDLAQRLSDYRFGWLILGAVMIVTSFPPLVGYSTSVSLCGFAYGMKGFLLAGPASLLGSTFVFIVLRLLFKRRLRSWTSQNEKWQALETVVRARGLPLIILIRASPFPPWVYANALFASIETVAWWQFVIATICMLPRLLIAVFIGSRVAAFSDGEQRGQMDTQTKIINGVSIGVGIILGIGTGLIVYRLMQKQIRDLRESPALADELAADALEDAEEGAPLLRDFSSESVNEVERSPGRRSS